MSFATDLQGYAKRTKLGIDKAVISVNTQVATSIIQMTPVDTGMARANWIPSIDNASNNTANIGNDSLAKTVETAQHSAGTVFYLTNNLPYIKSLEYGSSTQAPKGMVRLSIDKAQSALRTFNAK